MDNLEPKSLNTAEKGDSSVLFSERNQRIEDILNGLHSNKIVRMKVHEEIVARCEYLKKNTQTT